MSRTWLRCAITVVTASAVFVIPFSFSAHAAVRAGAADVRPVSMARATDPGEDKLAAAMLQNGDLPAGFQPYAPLTGPLDAKRGQVLKIDISKLGSQAKWVRTWISPGPQDEVIEIALDIGTRDGAQAAVTSSIAGLREQGQAEQAIGGPVRFAAFGTHFQLSGVRYFALNLPLARGPYYFLLHVYVPAQSAASASGLMSNLATAQWRKVPADTPDTTPGIGSPVDAAAGTAGALAGFLLMVDGIAYLRNPLRRRLRRHRSTLTRSQPDGFGITDVSGGAKRNKRIAVGRLAAQLAGLSIAFYGADAIVDRYGYWYAYLILGLAMVWAGGRFIHPAGVRRDRNRAMMAGSHRILVTGLLAVAMALILLGLAFLAYYGLIQTLPSGAALPGLFSPAPTTAQSLSSDLETAGFIFVALGAIIFRSARRLGSIHARRLMLRDPRPPVLYLRAFGDDRLKLWTATFGRPSLIERFTLRRFDTFEEVLVRYLSRHGPVIAINPPGTRLAPLGAARETIASADWQSAVADLMARSSLIVFVAPSRQVTRGLLWELQTVSASNYWHKALIVVPPVRAEDLQRRWQEFRDAGARLWPFTVPGPTEDPHALVLAFRNGQWNVTSANRRTEWSYGAALNQALGDPRRSASASPAQEHQPPRRGPTVRSGSRTLPIAALIVVLAAAVVGTGSWYAVRNTPAAHLSANATPSASGNSSSLSRPAAAGGSSPVSASPSSPPGNLVSVVSAAALYPGSDLIEPVVTAYFQAINSRDYAEYLTTQSPSNALTAEQFQTGFRSTQDSSVLVISIGQAPDGRLAADVTFTSRQQPQDGPGGESCTNWHVTMFFDNNAGTYTIGAPAAGYQASHQACS